MFGSSFGPPLMYAGGLTIIEDRHMTDTVEDWSAVRSPSRAARRRRQGHPQRIRYVETPKPGFYQIGTRIIGHPETVRKLTAALEQRATAR